MTQIIIDKNSNFTRKGGASRATPDATGPKKVTGQMGRFTTNGTFIWLTDNRRIIEQDGEEWSFELPARFRTRELAEFICRAINHHEKLLQALKRLLQHAGIADASPEDVDSEDHQAESAARAAIANVEKGNDHDTKD